MSAERTIHFSGQDDAIRRFLVFLAPSIQARAEVHADGAALLELRRSTPPDCLVVDAGPQQDSPRSALQTMQRHGACLPVIAVGVSPTLEVREKWLAAGAVTFIPIDDSRMLRSAIVAALELSRAHDRVQNRMQDFRRRLKGLSPKQHRVLNALIRGGSNKQIAVDHGVSERTLERRRAELIEELNVRSVIEAAWWYGRSETPEPGGRFRWPTLNLKRATADTRADLDEGDSAVIALAGSTKTQ